jgi:parvulin-like peptidyl-prolyl isomerase
VKYLEVFALRVSNRLLCFVFLFSVVMDMACDKRRSANDEEVLAEIGGRIITAQDFIKRYQEFGKRTGGGVPDTYHARSEVLNLYVDEEILIATAERNGIAEDAQSLQERERIEIQELLNLFNREMVAKRVNVTDAELKSLFVRLNTKVKARHLFAQTREVADSLHAALRAGASFEELARENFEDPKLRDSGGSLGYFTVDEMEPAFEDVAFALKVGEYSHPVKTSDGYSIIRVDDKITTPIITESDFARHRHKLQPYWRNRKLKTAIKAYADSLQVVLDIRFNEGTLQQLSQSLGQTSSTDEQIALKDDPLADELLVTSELGRWLVRDFRHHALFTDARQHSRLRNKEDLREFITGLLIREKVLKLSRRARLQEREEYGEKVAEQWDVYLLTRMEERLREEMPVDEDSVMAYYEVHKEKFATPARINLREIVLSDSGHARLVGEELQGGRSFEDLARSYSVRQWSAERGGELGFLAAEDFGQWANLVFSMNPGDRKGPVLMDSMYVFLECIARKGSESRSLSEAWQDVEDAVRYSMWDDYRKRRISIMRREISSVTVRAEKLKSLSIN